MAVRARRSMPTPSNTMTTGPRELGRTDFAYRAVRRELHSRGSARGRGSNRRSAQASATRCSKSPSPGCLVSSWGSPNGRPGRLSTDLSQVWIGRISICVSCRRGRSLPARRSSGSKTDPNSMSVRGISELMHFDKGNTEDAEKALSLEALAPGWCRAFEGAAFERRHRIRTPGSSSGFRLLQGPVVECLPRLESHASRGCGVSRCLDRARSRRV